MVYRREAKLKKTKKRNVTLFEYAGDILQAGLTFNFRRAFDYARRCKSETMASRSGNIRHVGKYDRLQLENVNLRTQISEQKSEISKLKERIKHLEEELAKK